MSSPAHVSMVRSLYKRILVLHRFMPIELKVLGDQYVKDEFRRHRSAPPEQVQHFIKEWEDYRDTLQTQVLEAAGRGGRGKMAFGTDLTERQLRDFQDEQIGQLYELMLESTKPNQQFNIQDETAPK